MATRLKEVDAVAVGMGFCGAILSRELTKAGLNVVGLERGADRNPAEEFTLTRLRDELRYVVRLELMQDNSIDTITFRNAPNELALPIRLPTRRRRRRYRHPLGGPALALPACGFLHQKHANREIRRKGHSADHDPPGLAGQL